MAIKKKAAVGIKTTKTAPDSTGYYNARSLKAQQLVDSAEKEGLGKAYNQKYLDNAEKARNDTRAYQQRKNGPAGPATSSLKKGGKVKSTPKAKCASCGTKAKKK